MQLFYLLAVLFSQTSTNTWDSSACFEGEKGSFTDTDKPIKANTKEKPCGIRLSIY